MKEQLTVKRLVILLIIMTMFLGSTLNMIGYAVDLNTFRDQVVQELESRLPGEVTAVMSVEKTARVGEPFKLNVRLKMPTILTYWYDEELPYEQPMYDEYTDVRVTIPLPDGVTAVDSQYVDVESGNLIIDFPRLDDNDFKGETDKSRDIYLKVLNNGAVENETVFAFEDATWSCNVNLYINEERNSTEEIEVRGNFADEEHMALASDSWAIQKKFIKTEEIGNQVVFSFDVSVGLEGVDEDGNKFLYSTATEQYDRYGRLNFEEYEVIDSIPELIQINRDGSQINKGVYPESVKVIKEAVNGYGIDQMIIYDSSDSKYEYKQGETKAISFNERNEYDPNAGTEYIGESPQYTKYTVKLAYHQDELLIDADDKVISTFKITNNAKLDYKLVGENKAFDTASAEASYVIRKSIGNIAVTKYITYPKDNEIVSRIYNEDAREVYPCKDEITFTVYEDKECTKTAKYLNGKDATARLGYDGIVVLDDMESGTYYLKESGTITGFEPVKNPVEVVIPREGGTVRVGFYNKNSEFGTIAVYKVRETAKGVQTPLGNVTFKIYETKGDAEAKENERYSITTDSNGYGFLNRVPVGEYYAREVTPVGLEPNEEIYTLKVVPEDFQGFKASDGEFYGTELKPIVNKMNVGVLYLGVVKWDLNYDNQKEINYLTPAKIEPVASAYEYYSMKLYCENDKREIVPYMENGKQVILNADSNGIVSKELPEGKYYVTSLGYNATKYTPWAQGNTTGTDYYMGPFVLTRGEDNYNLPQPDEKGKIDWGSFSISQEFKTNYNIIHNFSSMCNMSLMKTGSGQKVVPEARFDVYKIDNKGGALKNRIATNVATNKRGYAFFGDVSPGWYAFVETATGPEYYLPTNINERRKDMEITRPTFNQSLTGEKALERQKGQMMGSAKLVYFDNVLYDETPLIGLTFEKHDAETKNRIYIGAKFHCYYYENNDPVNGNRVYLGVFYYKTNGSKDANYKKYTYTDAKGNKYNYNIFPKGAPKEKVMMPRGNNNGGNIVPAFGDSPTTVVGWIPWNLLGKDIDLYVEELVPPYGYNLSDNEDDRIKKITVKGGVISEDVLVIENEPKPAKVNITVAVSNRNQRQTVDMSQTGSKVNTGTFVTGSTVRLYEWDGSTWKYVAQKNTSVNGTYITESGANFQVEYDKTYAIAEKDTNNKGSLYYYDVAHKWMTQESENRLNEGTGWDRGTYKLDRLTTIDGWTLYGPITMPKKTEREENYKFTFYNLPLREVWLEKCVGWRVEGYRPASGSGEFSIYRVPEGKSAYKSPVSELQLVGKYNKTHRKRLYYKGISLPVGNYVVVEEKAPPGYSNPNQRQAFSIGSDIVVNKKAPPDAADKIVVYMWNFTINHVDRNINKDRMRKSVTSPASGLIEDRLLGRESETINVSYAINYTRLDSEYDNHQWEGHLHHADDGPRNYTAQFKNVILEDTGLEYFAGQNGNGDKISMQKGDYTFTSITINPVAQPGTDEPINIRVEYKTADSDSWIKAADVKVGPKREVDVKLGDKNNKAVAFRLVFNGEDVKDGIDWRKSIYSNEIDVNAEIYKRDILKYEQDILSIKNSSRFSFDYQIYQANGQLGDVNHVEQNKEAIINVDPTVKYPKAKINKTAVVDGDGLKEKQRVEEGDIIIYNIDLTNTADEAPLTNPIILDKIPAEVSAMATGNIKDYFNISMPDGISLNSDSGLKTFTYNNKKNKYVALFFNGKLQPGQSIKVTFRAKVKADMVSVDDLITNQAAASSAKMGYPIDGNKASASFKNDSGAWPLENEEYKELLGSIDKSAYGYITVRADNVIERNSGIVIRKFVQGEMDKDVGYKSLISNTTSGGMVNYKIIVQNTGDRTIDHLRVADLLPQQGDSAVTNQRKTRWSPIPTGYKIYKVDKSEGESTVSHSVYTASGDVNPTLLDTAQDFQNGAGWSSSKTLESNATAVGFDFGDMQLEKGEYIVIEMYMKAPDELSEVGTIASNDAIAYYQESGDATTQPSIKSSTVHTLYHTRTVGVGGKIFLDKNSDGIRQEYEETISGVPVKLHVYEDGEYKETITTETGPDGTYYFDKLMPSYIDSEGNVKEGSALVQYQIEYVVPEGTCITDQYAGGADAWKNNAVGVPGTPAPKTTGDINYSDNNRNNDSNANVNTHKTEIFYLNPCDNLKAPIRTPEGGYDLTYDAGLVRVRKIELHKVGGNTLTSGKPLEGAVFKLTGTGLPADGITKASDENGLIIFDSPFTSNGVDYRINYYGNYKIEEVSAPDGYIYKGWFETIIAGIVEDSLTYDALNEESRETYTVFNPVLTSLTIRKTVKDGIRSDSDRFFKFIAMIDGSRFDGEYKVRNVDDSTFTTRNTSENENYIVLKHNEEAVIDGLVDGVLYSVKELPEEGFVTSGTNVFGTLSVDAEDNIASFVNEKERGYIRIKKLYEGNLLHRNDEFTFNVKVNGDAYNGYYYKDGVSCTAVDGKVVIKAGETAVIPGGVEQTYEVAEEASAMYETTVEATEGITVTENSLKAEGVFSKENIGEITYTNKLQTSGLYVTKKTSIDDSIFTDFYDTVSFTFKLEIDGEPYIGDYKYYGDKTNAANYLTKKTSDGTFTLTSKTGVYFDSLIKGTHYKITEIVDANSKYKYTPEADSIEGIVGTNEQVEFLNNYKTGNLKISKEVEGSSSDGTEFTFDLYINGKKLSPITYKRVSKDGNIKKVTDSTEGIKLANGDYVQFDNIPSGTNYMVVERAESYDYHHIKPDNYQGTIAEDTTIECNFVNKKINNDAYIKVVKQVNSSTASDFDKDYEIMVGITSKILSVDFEDGTYEFIPRGVLIPITTAKIKNAKDNSTESIMFSESSGGITDAELYAYSNNQQRLTGGKMSVAKLSDCEELIISKDDIINSIKNDIGILFDGKTVTSGNIYNPQILVLEKRGSYIGGVSSVSINTFSSNESMGSASGYAYLDGLYISYSKTTIAPVTHVGYNIKEIGDYLFDGSATHTIRNTRGTSTTEPRKVTITKELLGGNSFTQESSRMFDLELRTTRNYTLYSGDIISNLRGKMIVQDGKIDIAPGETLTLDGLPNKTYFRIKEIDTAGNYSKVYKYTYDAWASSGSSKVNAPYHSIQLNKNAEVIVENTLNASKLQISKKNVGGLESDIFDFYVYIDGKPYEGAYSIDGEAQSDMVNGELHLKGGQKALIEGLYPGMEYYVEEVPHPNYISDKTYYRGTTKKSTTHSAEFTNTIKKPGLTIIKNVIGGNPKHEFSFKVLIKQLGSKTYSPYTGSYNILDEENGTSPLLYPEEGVVTLKDGQSILINDVPIGAEYLVEEIENSLYTQTAAEGTSGVLIDSGNVVRFENTRKTNALSISKNQIGGSPDDVFNFTVYIDEELYSGKCTIQDRTGNTEERQISGGRISLKGGQTATIEGVPLGAEYEIEEDDRYDYEELKSSAYGKIEAGENLEEFINAKLFSNLIFSKETIGGNSDDLFTFNLIVNDNPYVGKYTLISDGSETDGNTENGKVSIKNGQQIRVSLLVGSQYELYEDDKQGYKKQIPLANAYSNYSEENSNIETSEGRAVGTIVSVMQRVDFTNIYSPEGKASLEINKFREGGNPSDEFTFNVTIDKNPYEGPYTLYDEEGIMKEGSFETNNGKITIQGGGRIYITDLSPNVNYEVREDETDGYTASSLLEKGILVTDEAVYGHLSANIADFVNTYATGGFAVTKNNIGGLTTDEFTFTAELITSEGYEPLLFEGYRLYEENEGGDWELMTDEDGNEILYYTDEYGQFKLLGGQKAVFEGFDMGSEIRISEESVDGYTTTVTVDEDGEPVEKNTAEIQISRETITEVTYNNDYIFAPAKAVIKIKKNLEGGEITAREFTFSLTSADGKMGIDMTATNDDDGNVIFAPIMFDETSVGKTYIFKIEEKEGVNPSIKYSGEVIYAKVAVSLNDDNKIIADVSYSRSTEPDAVWTAYEADESVVTISNIYVVPTHEQFKINKLMTGDSWEIGAPLIAGQYNFNLYEVNGGDRTLIAEASNGISPAGSTGEAPAVNEVLFPNVTFFKAGVYEYEISEIPGSVPVSPGVTFSTETVKVTVVVTEVVTEDGATHSLVSAVSYFDASGKETGNPAITNRYTKPNDITTTLEADKVLTGGRTEPLREGEFNFGVYNKNGELIKEASNKSHSDGGQITFEGIPITLGDNIFEIKEIIPEEDKRDVSIIRYDDTVYTAVVIGGLSTDKNSIVVVSTTYYKNYNTSVQSVVEKPVFNNEYQRPSEVKKRISLTKKFKAETIDGNWSPKKFGDHEFEFAIEAITEGAPLPADTTVRTTGKDVSEETVSFGDITFTEDVGDKPKTYVYKIKEVVPTDADPRVEYDDSEIYVKITVSKDGNNNLTASEPKFYDANGLELSDGAVFTNRYSMWTGGFSVIKQNIDGYSDDEFTFTVTADGVPLSNVSYKLYNKAVGDNRWDEAEETDVSTDVDGKFKLKGDQKAVFDNLAVDTKIVVTEDSVSGYSTAVETAEGRNEDTSSGQIVIEHDKKTNIKFINDYALLSEEVKISFEKQLIGSKGIKTLKEGQLQFELTADKEIPGVSLPRTATNDKDGKVTFDPIKFGEESVGQTYIFTAREIAGNDPSIIYTDDKVYAKVEVSRDANRQVVTNVTYSQNLENDDWKPASERTPTLINTYIEPTGVRFRINKKVEGSGWEIGAPFEKGQYSFLLFETTNGEEEFVAEVKNGILPAGTLNMEISPEDVIFPYVEFKEAKQYTYKIVELPGSEPGIIYSTQAIYITVNVSNNNNNLVAMVQYTGEDGEPLSEPTITNRYNKPNDITTSLEAVKTLEGDRAKRLEAGEFEFGLYQNDVLLREAYNSTDGNIRFDDVTVTLGDNIFEIKEIVPDEGHRDISITSYDNSIYTAVVNVGLNDDKSAMVVNSTEYFTNYGQSNQKKLSEEEVPVFVNTYTKPDEAVQTIGLTKKLVDKAGTPVNFGEDSFRFILSAVDKDAPMPTTGKEAVVSGQEISESSVSFGQITFSEDVPDEGREYVYKISEIIPENKAAGKNPSIEYDSRDIFARIIVTKKSDKNELVASEPEYFTVDSEENETVLSEALFENVYSTPEEASAIFTVTKKYIGKELKEGDFEFTLTPVDGAPGKQETVTNDADGKVEFSAISFAEDPGNGVKTYSYRISEVNKGYPSITYDDKDILVTVNVSKGEDNHLVSEVIYQKTGEAKPTSDPTFTNVYKVPEPADIQFSVKKEYKNGPKLKGGEFTFILMDKEGNGIDSAENDANGNVRFKDIKISSDLDEATYEYSIAEKSGNKTGVIYDKKIVDVKVKVIKGTEGEDKNKLLADVKYYIDGEETTAPTFNNIYSPPLVGTTVSITAKKEYKNGVLNGNDFKFRLEPTSDNPLKTTMYAFNDKNGNVYFAPLEFFSVGEYHYTLTEVAGDNKNVVYDTDKVDVTVKVTTTRYGTLTADVEYEKRGEKSNTFVNEYKDPDSTVANIFARKILKGRDLEGNEFEFLIQPTRNTKGESYSVRNSGDGTVSFKEMTFTEEGIYTYRIIELHSSTLKYITYDNVPINVTVTVTRNSDGRLMSYVSYKKDSEVSNTFINTYDRESEGLPPEKDDNKESEGLPPERNNGANNPKTGDQADFMGNLIVMLLSSLGLVVFFSTGKKKDKKRLNGTIR